LGITVANESSATVKKEAVILLHALSSIDASKHVQRLYSLVKDEDLINFSNVPYVSRDK